MPPTPTFDIIIVGAGPAGCTAALALSKKGWKVALLEKERFPRDKICGDAIPGPAFNVIKSINEKWYQTVIQLAESQRITSSRIVSTSGKSLRVKWVSHAYNARRQDFDNLLFHLVRTETDTTIFTATPVARVAVEAEGVKVYAKSGQLFRGKIVVGADGTNGVCARQLTDFQLDRNHHCAAVRAYMTGVDNLTPEENIFYFLDDYLPGYFWIFPLGNQTANVGFGMISSEISRKKYHLRKLFLQLIEKEPLLQAHFKNAVIEHRIEGFGLPLGSRLATLYGTRFMLCGDAGSLIDPLQGHGIDKAMMSAYLSAEVAQRALQKRRFDAAFLAQYERLVYQKFSAEFRRNYVLMRLVHKAPWLLEIMVRVADNPIGRWFVRKIS